MATRKREANEPDAGESLHFCYSKDLGTLRELVKQGLLTMGCIPAEQTNFPPNTVVYRKYRGQNSRLRGSHSHGRPPIQF